LNLSPSSADELSPVDAAFSARLLAWYAQQGRHDLPWQQDPSPYRVWVSEIMLQQTQVQTVIPYFQRFMAAFPDLLSLGQAPLDAVLHHWTGLGYYARARHLHRAAQQLCAAGHRTLPPDLAALTALPGIGPSTAGAILALAYRQVQPILDGNVKRVLCRYHALAGHPEQTAVKRQLWALAKAHTPSQQVAEYTQAIMDLGATCCTRSRPDCERCPQQQACRAYRSDTVALYPSAKSRRSLPVRQTQMLMLHTPDSGEVLLQQRPANGIWGGLWSFPECALAQSPAAWCHTHLGLHIPAPQPWATVRHTFTHFHLEITPVPICLSPQARQALQLPDSRWYNSQQPAVCGLAAPVLRLLTQLAEQQPDLIA